MYDLQCQFIRNMLEKNVVGGACVKTMDYELRLEVYRKNFMQGHCNALKKTFPITAVYLKEEFEEIAVTYVCENRPQAEQLFATYGDTFPSYLKQPIAKEIARLEWALQVLVMAAPDLSNQDFKEEENAEEVYWQVRSDIILFHSPYAVGEVYQTLRQGGAVASVHSHTNYYILYRQNFMPMIVPLTHFEFTALAHLRIPHTVDELFDKLTFSKETFGNLLPKIFNPNFLKVANVVDSSITKMCSII